MAYFITWVAPENAEAGRIMGFVFKAEPLNWACAPLAQRPRDLRIEDERANRCGHAEGHHARHAVRVPASGRGARSSAHATAEPMEAGDNWQPGRLSASAYRLGKT